MAYTTQAKIQALVPAPHLIDALDDDRDGQSDDGLLDQIIANSDNAIDAYLQGLYTVPFSPVPAACAEASLVFSCEQIYSRRIDAFGRGNLNPFTARANFWRTRLEKIGNGELPLDADTAADVQPGASILEDVDIDDTFRA